MTSFTSFVNAKKLAHIVSQVNPVYFRNIFKGTKHWPLIILHGEIQTQQATGSFDHAVTLLKHQNGKLRVKNSLKDMEVFGNVKQLAEHDVSDQVPHPYTLNDWSLAHELCWYVEFF